MVWGVLGVPASIVTLKARPMRGEDIRPSSVLRLGDHDKRHPRDDGGLRKARLLDRRSMRVTIAETPHGYVVDPARLDEEPGGLIAERQGVIVIEAGKRRVGVVLEPLRPIVVDPILVVLLGASVSARQVVARDEATETGRAVRGRHEGLVSPGVVVRDDGPDTSCI